jgi:3-dehydroquinate dehydratase-2
MDGQRMDGQRIEVMHGVNLDALGRRDPDHYGTFTLLALERQIESYATQLGLRTRFFQSNAEVDFIERLHRLHGEADGVIINAGAWSHYSWAIHDALEIAALPAVEIHLSDVGRREPWRQVSVLEDLCLAIVSGKGADGYRIALERLAQELEAAPSPPAERAPAGEDGLAAQER